MHIKYLGILNTWGGFLLFWLWVTKALVYCGKLLSQQDSPCSELCQSLLFLNYIIVMAIWTNFDDD